MMNEDIREMLAEEQGLYVCGYTFSVNQYTYCDCDNCHVKKAFDEYLQKESE